MKSWGYESSTACNLRRRCDLRARIRARAPPSAARASSCVLPLVSLSSASGRRDRVRSPASVTRRDSTSGRSAVVVSGTQQSSVAPSDVEPEARGFQLIRSTTRVRLLISIPWMAFSLVGVISTWESWRVECHHTFQEKKVQVRQTSHVRAGQKSTEIGRQCSRSGSGGKLSACLSASLVVS